MDTYLGGLPIYCPVWSALWLSSVWLPLDLSYAVIGLLGKLLAAVFAHASVSYALRWASCLILIGRYFQFGLYMHRSARFASDTVLRYLAPVLLLIFYETVAIARR